MATNFRQALNKSSGVLFGLPRSTSIESIFLHIQERLPQFAAENRSGGITNENGLTQRLVQVLSLSHKFPFFFDKEFMEDETKGNSARSDFAVLTNQPVRIHTTLYSDRSRILTFEAKRLANLGAARAREYLEGRYEDGKFINSGGVERFKNETHGKGLSQSGIIAYIQEQDFVYWEKCISDWTNDLISRSRVRDEVWDEGDHLNASHSGLPDYKYYQSTCLKAKGSVTIQLHHFWVSLV
jgi:hypothetical protein